MQQLMMMGANGDAIVGRRFASFQLMQQIEQLLEHDTAGDPISGLKWSRRTTRKVAEQLALLDNDVSAKIVCRLLKSMGYSLRTNRKSISSTESPQKNEQFEYIAQLRQQYASKRHPIISVDTRKKELVGQFKNAGNRCHCTMVACSRVFKP